MIENFVRAWDANKDSLANWLRQTNQEKLSYKEILRALLVKVINPFTGEEWDIKKIHTIDDGDYQGCQIFIVPKAKYQPSPYEYLTTYQDYGSCSGCDLLEGIRLYEDGLPSETQVKEYMTLALHLLQRCKYFMQDETYMEEK